MKSARDNQACGSAAAPPPCWTQYYISRRIPMAEYSLGLVPLQVVVSANKSLIQAVAGAPPEVVAIPGASDPRAQKLNDAINTATCQRDTRAAGDKAQLRSGPIHPATALKQSTRRRQPYLVQLQIHMLLRVGTLQRDCWCLRMMSHPRVSPLLRRIPRPLEARQRVASPEHAGVNDEQRQDAAILRPLARLCD